MDNYEAKLYINVKEIIEIDDLFHMKAYPLYIVFGNVNELLDFIEENKDKISKHYIEILHRNKLMDYYDLSTTKARIEKGAIIRSGVTLSDTSIVLMGAVINTKASIGDYTMIDMNAVVGSGTIIKNNCHVGAGVVIAGIMEPIENKNVLIEDNVFIGANATILAGVHIGKNAIIGAGSVVTKDVMENTTVVGVPARVVNTNGQWILNKDLR